MRKDLPHPLSLPNASRPYTVVVEHDLYDTMIYKTGLAWDWESRGKDYVLRMCKADPESRIVAMFPGHLYSEAGHGINE